MPTVGLVGPIDPFTSTLTYLGIPTKAATYSNLIAATIPI